MHIFTLLSLLKNKYNVLINTATFEFSARKIFTLSKYHKNTLCKILDDLKKLSLWQNLILEKKLEVYENLQKL